MKINAYAKLNLVLDVKGKLADSYHNIEFVNTQLELHDIIELEELNSGIVIGCSNPGIPTDSTNLCYKAAELMISKLPVKKGIKIRITKNIPLSAGLAGGSADAAAVFKGLNKLWNLKLTDQQLIDAAKDISTDACYCIVGSTCLVKGKGEIVEKLGNIPQLNIAVIMPNIQLDKKTAWMYSKLRLDCPHPSIQQMLDSISKKNANLIISSMANIFESVKVSEYDGVYKLIKELTPKCLKAMLAGSGPSIIAVTKTETEARLLAERYNGICTKTRQPKQIILADGSGFCYGVKRALELTETVKETNTYTLGPLIHNRQVIEQLEAKGINIADSIDDVNEGTIVIRAHGVPKQIIQEACERGISVLDATCPFVKSVQKTALELEKKGYQPVIFGDKDHPEVIGIAGNLKKPIIVKSIADVKQLGKLKKAGIVSQTTQPEQKFNDIVKELKKHCSELIVHNTICSATKNRQENTVRLAKQVDLMLVIGGCESGNTRRLKELCSKIITTIQIETAADLNQEMFNKVNVVGITAGASTPTSIIQEVIGRIENEF